MSIQYKSFSIFVPLKRVILFPFYRYDSAVRIMKNRINLTRNANDCVFLYLSLASVHSLQGRKLDIVPPSVATDVATLTTVTFGIFSPGTREK